jgi:hypothetical protein
MSVSLGFCTVRVLTKGDSGEVESSSQRGPNSSARRAAKAKSKVRLATRGSIAQRHSSPPQAVVEGADPVVAVADRERVAEAGADAGVRQVLAAVAEAHHERHVVPPGFVAVDFTPDAAADAAHVEAHGLQGVREGPVVLVAVAAAAALDEFREQRVDVEPDGPAELDVEVLVRHRGDVGAVDTAQRMQRRASRGVDADALQVGGELRGVEHPSTIARDAGPGSRRDRTDTGMMLRGWRIVAPGTAVVVRVWDSLSVLRNCP